MVRLLKHTNKRVRARAHTQEETTQAKAPFFHPIMDNNNNLIIILKSKNKIRNKLILQ